LKINLLIPTLLLGLFIFACSNRPSYVLSDAKMERVMYDIYLAEAEISANYTLFSTDSARKQALLNSVLKKHKITEAVLDTSLAWYSGHLEQYFKINENLSKRYAEEAEKLRQQEKTGETENKGLKANAENRIVFPVEQERILLSPIDLLHNSYVFQADTLLNTYGGNYQIQFDVMGLSGPLYPVVTLCVACKDTTFVRRDTLSHNGLFISSLDIHRGKQAQKLYGSIYFPEVSSGMHVFIQNFSLSRSLSTSKPSK